MGELVLFNATITRGSAPRSSKGRWPVEMTGGSDKKKTKASAFTPKRLYQQTRLPRLLAGWLHGGRTYYCTYLFCESM